MGENISFFSSSKGSDFSSRTRDVGDGSFEETRKFFSFIRRSSDIRSNENDGIAIYFGWNIYI